MENNIPVPEGTNAATGLDEAERIFREVEAQGTGPTSLMIKAMMGGGGRGVRIVSDIADLADAYERCRSEAETAFGCADVYVERHIPQARHVEVQIVGDGSGTVSHLGERECSLQRRHQKLIEIAPSPSVSPDLREKLMEAAVTLALAVDYRGLGTVEFLVDGSGKYFYFLEVNPRLQVEHTITEAVMGIDLVAAQFAIAGGASLADLGLDRM